MANPRLSKDTMHHYEEGARAIRTKAGVGPYERFDPLTRLSQLDVVLKYPDEVDTLPEDLRAEMNVFDAKKWSGMGLELPSGKLLAVLNRNQTPERARVTLLEEVAHQYYGHTPVGLGPGGRAEYHPEEEQEAKFTAAAALLPSREIAIAVYRSEALASLARKFGASVELVEMRIKTLNLWEHHKQREIEAAA